MENARLISLLSHRPKEASQGMIYIPQAPRRVIIPGRPTLPIPLLDTLPAELVTKFILNQLDFGSLCSFARVSFRAFALVRNLPAFCDLIRHGGKALVALGKTRLLNSFTVGEIHASILEQKCTSCSKYGAFLFLPTLERCCWACLNHDRSLWVVPKALASKLFSLDSKDLEQLKTMKTIPGRYTMEHAITHKKQELFVSLKEAKKLGLAIHDSEEVLADLLQSNYDETWKIPQKGCKYLLTVPLEAWDAATKHESTGLCDPFGGLASIAFPSLAGNLVEHGLWCFGCHLLYEDHKSGRLSEEEKQELPSRSELLAMRRCARSRGEFLEHIKHCLGAQKIIMREVRRH